MAKCRWLSRTNIRVAENTCRKFVSRGFSDDLCNARHNAGGAAILAACHSPAVEHVGGVDGDETTRVDAAQQLQWGAVITSTGEDGAIMAHCCWSSGVIKKPRP
jgi:hypothetical protein